MRKETDTSLREFIFKSSRVPGFNHVYAIYPYGYRSGFLFQQEKAINLITALSHEFGDALRQKKIAVIGGGVAGVTASAALQKIGVTVVLYEKSEAVLSQQKDTEGRLIHPNYNRWPMLDEMNIFTRNTIMNWHADEAKNVINRMKDEFNKSKITQEPNSYCLNIIENGKNLTFDVYNTQDYIRDGDKTNCKQIDDADIIILSTGFGKERYCDEDDGNITGYWNTQEALYEDAMVKKSTLIIGTGDGAIIDAIKCWSKIPQDFWEVPLHIISSLRDEKYNHIAHESAGTSSEVGVPFTELENEIRRHESNIASLLSIICSFNYNKNMDSEAEALINQIRSSEELFYVNFVKKNIYREQDQMFQEKYSFLNDYLLSKSDKSMKIYGLWESPFDPTSAPINKIMLAILILTKRIDYVKSTKVETEILINSYKSAWPIDLVPLVRTGPGDNPIEALFERGRPIGFYQRSIFSILSSVAASNYTPIGQFTDAKLRAEAGTSIAELDQKMAENHESLVQSFAERRINPDIKVHFQKAVFDKTAAYIFSGPAKSTIDEALPKLGGLERYIFGFPIRYGANTAANADGLASEPGVF